ncbi:MAG: transposase [Acidobacteriia bacterium]|nr:transposase [Terriglobia bacterium]
MPQGLKRYYGAGHLHFITCSCYQRRAWLGTARRRDLFLRLLEKTRQKYGFVVVGYVVMPEHFHLLISEPQVADPSKVMQVVKQRFAQRILRRRRKAAEQRSLFEGQPLHIWQARFYDFNVWTERKRIEKRGAPGLAVFETWGFSYPDVQRGLVLEPQQWRGAVLAGTTAGRWAPYG